MARCLGLIEDHTRNAIDAIRELRNSHAHGTAAFHFTEENLKPIAAQFHPTIQPMFCGVEGMKNSGVESLPRRQMYLAFIMLLVNLGTNFDFLRSGSVGLKVRESPPPKGEGDNPGVV